MKSELCSHLTQWTKQEMKLQKAHECEECVKTGTCAPARRAGPRYVVIPLRTVMRLNMPGRPITRWLSLRNMERTGRGATWMSRLLGIDRGQLFDLIATNFTFSVMLSLINLSFTVPITPE